MYKCFNNFTLPPRYRARPASVAVLICLGLLWYAPLLKAETLNAGVEPWTPWIIKEDGKYTGITIEICTEAFRRTGHHCHVMEVPTKRRELLEWGRSVLVEPGCEKKWRSGKKKVSAYTIAYIQTRNVIVTRKGCVPKTTSLSSFYNSTIGANRGYFYTDGLSEAFDSGLIKRDDCGTGHLLISKLIKKRVNAIVADTYEWHYWMKNLGQDPAEFEEAYTFSHSNELRIRVHKSKAYLIGPLNRALMQMQADGTITKILRRFLVQ